MKKYILTSLMALMCVVSVSYAQTMFVDEILNGDSIKHAYDVNMIDSVAHVDSSRQVVIYANKHYRYAYQTENIDRVYFSDKQGVNGTIKRVGGCSAGEDLDNSMGGNSNSPMNPFVESAENDTILTYKYDPKQKQLTLKLISYPGNCCGEGWTMNLATVKDTIDVQPVQKGYDICNCICRFDLAVELKNIEAKKYRLKLDGKNYDIDLSQTPEGFFLDVPTGVFVKNSPCKSNIYESEGSEDHDNYVTSFDDGYLPKGDTLVTYTMDYGTCLVVSHDREFNCCPGKIESKVRVSKDTVYINSYETEAMCSCDCLYDVTTKVENLKNKKYIFVVDGTEFVVDMTSYAYGEKFVILRGERGAFFKSSECKNSLFDNEKGLEYEEPTTVRHEKTDTLVSYWFNVLTGEGEVVSHNLLYNCCAELDSKVSIQNDTIIIKTIDKADVACKCMCTFDVTTKLYGLQPRKYHFIVDGTEFDMDYSPISAIIYKGVIMNEPNGVFVKSSPCKKESSDLEEDKEPNPTRGGLMYAGSRSESADTLVSYKYDPKTGECVIVSYDVNLTCCGEVGSSTKYEKEAIVIKGYQTGDICRCQCVYDITTKVQGLKKQKYRFVVDGDEFEVDFSQETEGVVTR
ncbi:MAG: hypothetical protein J5767_05105 [Paludibacteraceae bacterium]|nr:hypothetical protein [Paludibacteraceae bacterium]